MCRLALALAALLCVLAPAAHARPGDLDRSFSKDGKLGFNPYKLGGTVRGLALVDGVRPLLSVQGQRQAFAGPTLVSLSAAGRITRRVLVPPPALYAGQIRDGHTLIEFAYDPAAVRYGLSRIGSTAMTTLTFEPRTFIGDFHVDDQGRVTVAGGIQHEVQAEGRVWRFLPDGTPDRTFGGDGSVELPGYGARGLLVPRRAGGLYVSDGLRLTVLDASGHRLPGFRERRLLGPKRGRTPYAYARSIVPAPGGRLYVIGNGDYGSRSWVSRLRADGSLDTGWSKRGYLSRVPAFRNASFSTATVDRRGRLLLAGSSLRTSYGFSALIVRRTVGGRADRTFASGGRKVFRLADVAGVDIDSSDITHVAVDARGRIVLAGNAYDSEFVDREDYGNPYPAIARLKG